MVLKKHKQISYTRTDDRFRSLLPVAEANGLCIVNAGFAFDEQLLNQLQLDFPDAGIGELDPAEVLGVLAQVDMSTEAGLIPLVDAAEKALEGQKLAVEVRCFSPAMMPVLFLPHPDAAGRALEARESAKDGLFGDIIDLMNPEKTGENRPQLIFNANAPIVHQLASAVDGGSRVVVESAVRGFYVQALLAGRHHMDAQVRAWSTNLFTALISASLDKGSDTEG